MAFGANIHAYLWVQTVDIANYLINLSPIRINGGLTPHQQLFGAPLDFHHLKGFGCFSLAIISTRKVKWSPKSLHFMLISYNSTSKGYWCFLPKKNKVIMSKDVIFYEDHFSFPPAIIIVSTNVEPCITPPIVPLLNLGVTPPRLTIVDELDTWGDPIIDEGSQVLEASSPLVSIPHFDQQNEDSYLLGNATYSLNRSDKAQKLEFQYDIQPSSIQL